MLTCLNGFLFQSADLDRHLPTHNKNNTPSSKSKQTSLVFDIRYCDWYHVNSSSISLSSNSAEGKVSLISGIQVIILS